MDPITVPEVPQKKGWKTWTGGIGLILLAATFSPLGLNAWDWATTGTTALAGLTAIGIGDKVQKLINTIQGK